MSRLDSWLKWISAGRVGIDGRKSGETTDNLRLTYPARPLF